MTTPTAGQPVHRAFAILFALQGHSFQGLRLTQVAQAIRASAPTALRTLEVLAQAGIAERIPGDEQSWRLSPRLVQVAIAHHDEAQRLHRSVDEFDRRYTRLPT
ncbi:MAG: helix-turn-helix domain-containing protein [Proteobacteria bacterium]|nr:helix-turn-helix domain-containing protein [Pseudomonadota bacterium]